MVTVKFFGLISINNNLSKLNINPGTIGQIIEQIILLCPSLNILEFERAIVFVNKCEISGSKRFTTVLKSGDELVFINPSSGG